MDRSALAMVTIDLRTKAVHRKDMQLIVKLLRAKTNVDDLAVHYGKITFHLWGKDRVDFGILDRIKDELKKNFPALKISAVEYSKTARKYVYDAGRLNDSKAIK